ncbi:substrate-binding domain-containing protein [Nisaea sp.]|uniref:substrate-binding domain-containing protein n=1 Tax=Nisaea sp. TaxID=2024842 RepID=UPI0032F06295
MRFTPKTIAKLLGTLVLLGIVAAAPGAVEAQGVLTVSGSTTVDNTIMTPFRSEVEQKSGLKLKIVGNGSGNGIADLEAGKADVAMISSPMENVIAKANKKKPGSIKGDGLISHPVGGTKLFVVVNKSNPVAKTLTADQVRAIFKGEISNWNEVGGPDAAIQIFSERAGGGARATLEKSFLKGEITPKAKPVGGVALGVKVASQNPKAITFAGRKMLNDKVVAVESVLVEQPLWLVTKGEPTADAASLIKATAEIGNAL